nr:hypothetical protein RVX_2322 [Nitratidesulfovibrio sp. HK-II]
MTKLPVQADTDWMPDARHTPRVRRAFGERPEYVRRAPGTRQGGMSASCLLHAPCAPRAHRTILR